MPVNDAVAEGSVMLDEVVNFAEDMSPKKRLMASPGVQKIDFPSDWTAVFVSGKSPNEASTVKISPSMTSGPSWTRPSSIRWQDPANTKPRAARIVIVLLITLYVIGVLVFLVTSDSFVASNQDSGLNLDADFFAHG